MKAIQTDKAPQAIGCYSQAVMADPWLFISGQIGIDPKTQTLVEGFGAQLKQVFDNLEQILLASACSFAQVVKLQIYLVDLNHFTQVNEEMAQRFTLPYPARATIQVSGLPKGALIEIDAVAKI